MSYIGTTPAPQMTEVGTGSVETQDIQDGAVTAAKLAAGAAVPAQTGQSGKFLTTNGTAASWATVQTGVTIANITYSGDDLAVSPTTPLQCTLTGTGFVAGTVIYIDTVSATNSATAITVVSSTSITFTPPAGKAANNYNVWAVLPTGVMAVLVNGILYSGTPNWSSQPTSLAVDSQALSIQLTATGDTPLVYSLVSGTLPPGTTLSSTGLISGTVTAEAVYPNIVIRANDPQNQDASVTIQITISLSDPFFKNTTLLLSGNGTNGAQNNTFLDSSTNNFTLTRSGNVSQGTFSPYGSNWSNYFDGSGDYFQVSSTPFDFSGGQDFTLEFFMYILEGVSYGFIYQNYTTSSGITGQAINAGTNFVGFENWNGGDQSPTFSLSGTTIAGQWNHVALVRNGSGTNNVSLYINGSRAQQGTLTSFTAPSQTSTNIGARNYLGYKNYLTGYISNFRIVKGTGAALYSGATYTVPTAKLTAVTNTALLVCADNRFIDSSTNNYAITRTGDVNVQDFGPFAPTNVYSPSVFGGSGYFSGSTTYLSAPSSTAFALGTGDFTIECWFYRTTSAGGGTLIGNASDGSGNNNYIIITAGAAGQNYVEIRTDSGSLTISGNVTPGLNTWVHVAATRQSGTLRLFTNGILAGSQTNNNNVTQRGMLVGGFLYPGYSEYFPGYISDARVIKGTALYTSAFTPPTAPLTAVTNTSLLCNMTNAGIIDSAMTNNLETVGNAQISTAVKKYGTGSIYFDATGDYLAFPPSLNYAFGTGDFTIETWMYTNTVSARGFFQLSDTAGGFKTSYTSGIIITLSDGNTAAINANILNTNVGSPAGAIAIGTWYHLAVTRQSGSVRVFLNGTLVGGPTTIAGDISAQNIVVGGYYNTSYLWNGYLDDFRITKGVARYTANFTVPSEHKGR